MTERYSPIDKFDRNAVSETLQTQAAVTRDLAHGEGTALAVGDGKAVLEVYPGAGVARVSTVDARVEVYRIPGYSLNQRIGRVLFDHGPDDHRMRLLVHRDGMVSFHPIPQAAESPQTAETTRHDDEATTLPPEGSEPSTPPQERSAAPAADPETGEQEEIQLQGRLGRDPWFATDTEEPIARFPLAVNSDTGKTTWHRVVVFGEAATELQEAYDRRQIRKGRLVEVSGQRVARPEEREEGRTRINREFHAMTVTRLTASKERPNRGN